MINYHPQTLEPTMKTAITFNIIFFLQSLEDHTDLAQAAYVYALLLGFVLVFCGLGTKLSEQVSHKYPVHAKLVFKHGTFVYVWL
jgi:hypothetical protein